MGINAEYMGDIDRTMAARFKPLFDRVLVQRAAAMNKTAGGIMLPESVQSKVNEATVIAVGPGKYNTTGSLVPMSVSVGDKVLLPEYGGSPLKFDEDEYVVFRDEDIIGIME